VREKKGEIIQKKENRMRYQFKGNILQETKIK
jgi:hypothetical protein